MNNVGRLDFLNISGRFSRLPNWLIWLVILSTVLMAWITFRAALDIPISIVFGPAERESELEKSEHPGRPLGANERYGSPEELRNEKNYVEDRRRRERDEEAGRPSIIREVPTRAEVADYHMRFDKPTFLQELQNLFVPLLGKHALADNWVFQEIWLCCLLPWLGLVVVSGTVATFGTNRVVEDDQASYNAESSGTKSTADPPYSARFETGAGTSVKDLVDKLNMKQFELFERSHGGFGDRDAAGTVALEKLVRGLRDKVEATKVDRFGLNRLSAIELQHLQDRLEGEIGNLEAASETTRGHWESLLEVAPVKVSETTRAFLKRFVRVVPNATPYRYILFLKREELSEVGLRIKQVGKRSAKEREIDSLFSTLTDVRDIKRVGKRLENDAADEQERAFIKRYIRKVIEAKYEN